MFDLINLTYNQVTRNLQLSVIKLLVSNKIIKICILEVQFIHHVITCSYFNKVTNKSLPSFLGYVVGSDRRLGPNGWAPSWPSWSLQPPQKRSDSSTPENLVTRRALFIKTLFRMSKCKFSREEMLKLLKEDKILGDDVAQLVDMSFIKSPEKNPELIMDCFILALDQLGYRLGFELLEYV